MKRAAAILACLLSAISAVPAAEQKRDDLMRYGEQLADECVTCHRRDGKDEGIPGIIFMSEQEIVNALVLYKTGRRNNKTMISVAVSLDDQQMRAVAAYLSSLGQSSAVAPPASPSPPPAAAPPPPPAPTPPKPRPAR